MGEFVPLFLFFLCFLGTFGLGLVVGGQCCKEEETRGGRGPGVEVREFDCVPV